MGFQERAVEELRRRLERRLNGLVFPSMARSMLMSGISKRSASPASHTHSGACARRKFCDTAARLSGRCPVRTARPNDRPYALENRTGTSFKPRGSSRAIPALCWFSRMRAQFNQPLQFSRTYRRRRHPWPEALRLARTSKDVSDGAYSGLTRCVMAGLFRPPTSLIELCFKTFDARDKRRHDGLTASPPAAAPRRRAGRGCGSGSQACRRARRARW